MPDTDRRRGALFVVLPNLNVWNADEPGGSQVFLRSVSRQLGTHLRAKAPISLDEAALNVTLIDEVAPRETVLVSMDEAERFNLLRAHPGLRIVPVAELSPLWLRRFKLSPLLGVSAGTKTAFDVKVVDAATGKPLAGVEVVGMTDRANRVGATNTTNSKGVAKLLFPSSVKVLDSVEAFAPSGHWPAYASAVRTSSGSLTLSCAPIDLAVQEARGHFGFEGADADGAGVKVAVVDTGVAKHKDLRVAKAQNVVKGEAAKDASDLIGHGTHVCGIIAGQGKSGTGVRGVAPAVELHVYRVFAKGLETALSFNIAKGIRQAVDDGCDLINLSLGGEVDIPDVLREIQRARALGVVCVAATGNDYRGPVNYPARYSQTLGISAFGRKATYPAGAAQELEEDKPFGTDKKNFMAGFSNVGNGVDLSGPGVGIVSAYPGGYAVMDGTSMACPVATGALARALAGKPKVLGMDRNQKRSDAIVKLALTAVQGLGFGVSFEGAGLLR